MLARTISYITLGLDARPVDVEVDAGRGLPGLALIGLPDQAVKEAKERVRTAILNSQYELPSRRLTVNLAPADIKKEGGVFDLPIALGILAASGQLDPGHLASVAVIGELALDGGVRPVDGVLPMALAAHRRKQRLMLPLANAREAAMVSRLPLLPVGSLREAADVLCGAAAVRRPARGDGASAQRHGPDVDLSDVKGQAHAKRALELAAAGGHHLLFVGPPGSGKSMLAQRLPTILPALSRREALEVTAVHSVAGLLNGQPLMRRRPFRAPHHTCSAAALIGGGSQPKPGEVSLAHHGVLFLDELPEFRRDALESLRQPLEEGCIRIARVKSALTFPAQFALVAAMNPCPCGYLAQTRSRCDCPSTKVAAYRARISGPLLNRIDLHVEVPAVPFEVLTRAPEGDSSAQVQARVQQAHRYRQARGQAGPNAHLHPKELRTHCRLTPEALKLLGSAVRHLELSARAHTKILKIARTIADLAGEPLLQPAHVAEAAQYRSLDRRGWE